jgi:hypothetical protein
MFNLVAALLSFPGFSLPAPSLPSLRRGVMMHRFADEG